jgi:NADH-quinone oxidoreductase subunit J
LFGATIVDSIVFSVACVFALIGALGVISFKNPVHSALGLVLCLFSIAVLFIEQGADFLAAVQIIVYAGAIVVLFLFVIMLLGVDKEESVKDETLKFQLPLAILAVAVLIGLFIAVGIGYWVSGANSLTGNFKPGVPGILELARAIFTTYLVPFEATAALLVIAVVGAVMLVKREGMAKRQSEEITVGEQN